MQTLLQQVQLNEENVALHNQTAKIEGELEKINEG